MYIGEHLRFEEGIIFGQIAEVPWWARAEHMERTIPLKELSTYSDSPYSRRSLLTRVHTWIKGE